MTLIAPLLGGAGLITSAILAVANFGTLLGSGSRAGRELPWLYVGAVAIGLAALVQPGARRRAHAGGSAEADPC